MVDIKLSSNKVSLYGAGTIKTNLVHRRQNFPLIYGIALQRGFLVRYAENRYSRVIYLGKSERAGGTGRAYAHLRWMQKVMLLNPAITYFNFIASNDGDIPIGEAKAVEESCLYKFNTEFGRLPLFNSAGGKRAAIDVSFKDRNLLFRKFREETASGCQIIDVSGRGTQNG